jgi:uncharacterized protein YndB with AHSA1/START domain
VKRADYAFLTTWLVGAPAQGVWDAIYDAAAWPTWWRAVTHVHELEPGRDDGIGKVFAIGWRSRLPYVLEFRTTVTRLDPPHVMEGRAEGDLTGVGRWRLFDADGATAVVYEWNVSTTKGWMNLVAPVARPVFHYNHDWVMRAGGEGLACLLGAPLLAQG